MIRTLSMRNLENSDILAYPFFNDRAMEIGESLSQLQLDQDQSEVAMMRTSSMRNLENSDILAYPFFNDRAIGTTESFDQIQLDQKHSKEDHTISLHEAVEKDDYETAKGLLEEKADVNKRNENQMMPLHLAVINGSYKMIELLLTYGADVNPTRMSAESKAPLFLAAERNSIHIAQMLLTRGALVNQAVRGANTVFDVARHNSNYALVNLLEEFSLKQTSKRSDKKKKIKKSVPLLVKVLKMNAHRLSRRYGLSKRDVEPV